MFKEKQLDRLVKAGIITAEQQKQILAFDDKACGGFVMQALNLLGIFTIGIGVISLVASHWEYISDILKLIAMFGVLFCTAGISVWYKFNGQDNKAEKWLVALFLFVGATIGLVIQVYQLNGEKIHSPFLLWWASTLPLLFATKKKYVAWFWVPLFLVWCAMFSEGVFGQEYWLKNLLAIYAGLFACGFVLSKYKPDFVQSEVLRRDACFAFYLVLAIYICWFSSLHFIVSALILLLTSVVYRYFKDDRMLRLNIKFAGLWVFCLYWYLGDRIGLLETGVGLIISGVVFIVLLKCVARLSKQVMEKKKNA